MYEYHISYSFFVFVCTKSIMIDEYHEYVWFFCFNLLMGDKKEKEKTD